MITPRRPSASMGRSPIALAVLLCILFTSVRSFTGWDDLVALRLPDTDDLMRLVQIRDWMGGQAFHDVNQYRLGAPPPTAMHWSRLGDVGPALIITAASPLLGIGLAEQMALILWPAALFLAFMLVGTACAQRLGNTASARIAVILFALAWPATSLFVPGRIDHHGLQLVLLLMALLGMLGRPDVSNGALAGAAIAASLAIGIELAVQLAVISGWVIVRWIGFDDRNGRRMLGLAAGLGPGLLILMGVAPENWDYPGCDAFTKQAATAAMAPALAFVVLAAGSTVTTSVRSRLLLASAVGLAVVGSLTQAAPACLADPYAAVDPLVRTRWLAHVEEARGFLTLPLDQMIGHGGLPLAGLVGGAILLIRHRARGSALLWLVLLSAILVAAHQVRALHIAAALAPILLTPLVSRARRQPDGWAPLAWVASIGFSYQLLGALLAGPVEKAGGWACDFAPAISQLQDRPPATVLAPIDLGPRLLAETSHQVIAAPYHRNDRGIATWLKISLLTGGDRLAAARNVGADYLIDCPSGTKARLIDLQTPPASAN